MNYIVLDLEWNQYLSRQPCPRNKKGVYLRNEIIQIGAVRLDDNFRPADTFKIAVRLPHGKKISAHVAKIVQISQEDLQNGTLFPEAARRFRAFCGEDCTFLVWGFDDIPILRQNLQYYYMDDEWAAKWYNLQLIFSAQHALPLRQIALTKAAEMLQISLDLPMHDALNDALYTAHIASALDMPRGLAEYKAPPPPKPDPTVLCDNKHFRCNAPQEDALKDVALNYIPCPVCGVPLADKQEWIAIAQDKYAMMARCETHGNYVIRIFFTPNRDGSLHASRMTYTGGGRFETDYVNRMKRRARLASGAKKRRNRPGSRSRRRRKTSKETKE